MANIILKLFPNKWDEKNFFSLIPGIKGSKDQHFLAHNNNKKEIQAQEHWECFIWDKKEKSDKILYKVIPFRKVDESKLKEEQDKVRAFNRELEYLESIRGKDFPEIKFTNGNTPFLIASITEEEITLRYPGFMIMREDEKILARPSKEMFKRLVHFARPKKKKIKRF